MGIPSGAQWVCFLARDSAYLNELHPHKEWNYHDYRDCDIENYLDPADEMVRRGYFALRIGAVVGVPLTIRSPGVIDYATKHRTDFMDIYLSAKCRFFLTSGAGIAAVPQIFHRPTAYANAIPMEILTTWGPRDLIVPKKLWMREEERSMTFREIIDSGAGRFMKQNQYELDGLVPVENTPKEIMALAIEMDERLNGTWQPADGDRELQRRFRSLFEGSELYGKLVVRIGTEFLRQNRELLD
jgi:putative glycosyltransferase (TIGR04372 family)